MKLPNKKEIAQLIDLLYDQPGCGAGGAAHIVTDDFNVDNEHLQFCAMRAAGTWAEQVLVQAIMDGLATFSPAERREIVENWPVLASE